ncbi:outer membrane protein [Celeribacter sp.]|uniref:outer membrane protein n=1 Tax=Celeribacter sp. TaxID=1890673 RepID=UPI003A932395
MTTFIKSSVAATAVMMAASPLWAGSPEAAIPEPVITTAAPVIATGTDWTGGYAGATLGYGWGADDADGVDGEVYGIHGGYNYDFGDYVIGGEVEYLGSGMSEAGDEIDDMARVKLRAGYDAGDMLFYGVLGATYANATISGNDYSDTGVSYGVGVDYAINDAWTAGVELLHTDFSEFDDSSSDVGATTLGARLSMRF